MFKFNSPKSTYRKHPIHWKMFFGVFFIFIIQNQSTYAQQVPEVSETSADSIENPQLLRESLARKRKAKKAARRKKFLSTLPKNHNPKTATLLALLPGVGQIYNRRYWKLPIVYAGIGTLGYFTISSYIEYGCFRKAYLHRVDDDPNTNYQCSYASGDTLASNLKIYRDNARESAETFVFGLTIFYGLTIIDAFVDAHLMHFDIDDDLSMRIEPKVDYDFAAQRFIPSVGLSVFPRIKEKKPLPVFF